MALPKLTRTLAFSQDTIVVLQVLGYDVIKMLRKVPVALLGPNKSHVPNCGHHRRFDLRSSRVARAEVGRAEGGGVTEWAWIPTSRAAATFSQQPSTSATLPLRIARDGAAVAAATAAAAA